MTAPGSTRNWRPDVWMMANTLDSLAENGTTEYTTAAQSRREAAPSPPDLAGIASLAGNGRSARPRGKGDAQLSAGGNPRCVAAPFRCGGAARPVRPREARRLPAPKVRPSRGCEAAEAYLSSTRVPRIFCALIA